ncbi:hypothetical protein HY78_02415 [Rhizorhabdus wittichii DC-6]|nr:hypothetical protein HY78_02415 [Rhizorhabdus wittichii DC-6]
MELSSTFCRVQEIYQRDRAANAMLNNIRIVADRAASAWGAEALVAERREVRRERLRVVADIAALENEQALDEEDGLFSENPDRSFANA